MSDSDWRLVFIILGNAVFYWSGYVYGKRDGLREAKRILVER